MIAYQLRLLSRTPRALVGGLLLPQILLAIRSGGGADVRLVVGLAVLGVVSTAYVTHAAGLVAARQAGVLKRWRASPLPRWGYFAGRIGATVLLATASGALTVLAGVLFYNTGLDADAVAILVAVLAAGAISWAALGTMVTTWIPSADAAWPLLAATYLPVILLSGVFGAIGAPHWIAEVMRWLPAEPVIDAARAAQHHALAARDLAVLAAWALVGFLVAQWRFRWTPR